MNEYEMNSIRMRPCRYDRSRQVEHDALCALHMNQRDVTLVFRFSSPILKCTRKCVDTSKRSQDSGSESPTPSQ